MVACMLKTFILDYITFYLVMVAYNNEKHYAKKEFCVPMQDYNMSYG